MTHKGNCFIFADSLCNSELIEVPLEVAILTELKDNIEVLSAAEAVMHFDDEG